MKILIIEDDIALRCELKKLLDGAGYTGIILENFENVVENILEQDVDLVLLDIMIPNIQGEYVLKSLRQKSNVPVIMVTSKDSEMDEVMCMSLGADDYITKPYHPTILLLRIEAVLKRAHKNQEIKNTYKGRELIFDKSVISYQGKEVLLSKNELQIFSFLIKHVGKIVKREELMDYLWDTDTFIDDNTLTVNMTRLKKKLEEVGLQDAIETRRGQGYILK